MLPSNGTCEPVVVIGEAMYTVCLVFKLSLANTAARQQRLEATKANSLAN